MTDHSTEAADEKRTGSASARVVVVVLGAIIVLTIFSVWLPSMSLRQEFREEIQIDVSAPVPGFDGRAALAVLPFESAGDPSQVRLADGLAAEIIAGLQTQRTFPVIARESTFTYRNDDAREAARAFGAGYVLEGSVQRHADTLEVEAQLIDAEGARVWGETFDGTAANFFDLSSEITAQLARILDAAPREVQLARPADPQAWERLMEAEARLPIESLEESTEVERLVLSALELDRGLGAAHVILGEIDFTRATELGAPFDETIEQAIEHAREAKRFAPRRAAICACLGTYLGAAGYLDEALGEHAHALERSPSSALARGRYAWTLTNAGRYEEGLEQTRIAMRLSPRDPGLYRLKTGEGIALMMLGDLEPALHALRQASSMSPSWTNPAHIYLVVAEYAAGRTEAARKEARRVSRTVATRPLSQLVPTFGVERPMTAMLRETIRDEFAGDVDAASELEVFSYVLRRAGWSVPVEPGETEG